MLSGKYGGRLTPRAALQGTLVSETRCLACKTVTTREEAFYDLSLDIEQNCSLTACLQNFRYPPEHHLRPAGALRAYLAMMLCLPSFTTSSQRGSWLRPSRTDISGSKIHLYC